MKVRKRGEKSDKGKRKEKEEMGGR